MNFLPSPADYQQFLQPIPLTEGETSEYEVRYTEYLEGPARIMPGTYGRLLEELSVEKFSLYQATVNYVDEQVKGVELRKFSSVTVLQALPSVKIPATGTVQQKTYAASTSNNPSLKKFAAGLSFSRATEKNLNIAIVPTKKERSYQRHSWHYDTHQIDLTKNSIPYDEELERSSGFQKSGNRLIYYQLEVEIYVKDESDLILTLLSKVQNTRYFYSLQEKFAILRELNDTLYLLQQSEGRQSYRQPRGAPGLASIDPKIIVQPHNLRMKEISWGQIYGGHVTYAVTAKADGMRRLLYIRNNGLWLVAPKEQVRLVMPASDATKIFLQSFHGTICDGEWVPESAWRREHYDVEKNQPPQPGTDWFLIFDCLQYTKSMRIIKEPLFPDEGIVERGRFFYAQEVANEWRKLAIPDLQLDVKGYQILRAPTILRKYAGHTQFMDALDPAENFFVRLRGVIDDLAKKPYVTDGLIFTPIGPYDTSANRAQLYQRTIARYPHDVLKWKPSENLTIDLAVFSTQVYATKDRELVQLPITLEQATGFPDGSIVEFRIVGEKLIPLKPRWDKPHPNDLDIVEETLKMARFPITAETLAGRNFRLLSAYFNRLKDQMLPNDGGILLDIGSGQGADLWKFKKFKKVYLVEPNQKNREELQRRIIENKMNNCTIIPRRAELGFPEIPDHSVQYVTLFLSLTFFWEPSGIGYKLESLLREIDRKLMIGGRVFFLVMDGNVIEDYFGPVGPLETAAIRITELDLEIRAAGSSFAGGEQEYSETEYGTLRMLRNGQIYINLPGSIVKQNESLVFLQDLLWRWKNYALEKFLPAEKELLLPQKLAVLSQMYSVGELVKMSTDVRAPGPVTSLTVPQLPEQMQQLAVEPSLPRSANPLQGLTPIIVTPPAQPQQMALNDSTSELLPTGLLWYPRRLWPQDTSEFIAYGIQAFGPEPRQFSRIAIINDDNSLYHAILLATTAEYSHNPSYGDRVALAQQLRQLFLNWLEQREYTKLPKEYELNGVISIGENVPTGAKILRDMTTLEMFTTDPANPNMFLIQNGALVKGNPAMASTLNHGLLMQIANSSEEHVLLPLLAAFLKLNIAWWSITPEGTLNLENNSLIDNNPDIVMFPQGILLLGFPKAEGGRHFELLALETPNGKQVRLPLADQLLWGTGMAYRIWDKEKRK